MRPARIYRSISPITMSSEPTIAGISAISTPLQISGLTDRAVARSPGPFLNKLISVEQLLDQAPRFFVLVNQFPIATRIALHPEFPERYGLVFERNHRFNWTPPDSYTLHVFERKGAGGGR